jgi:hypothetical protein
MRRVQSESWKSVRPDNPLGQSAKTDDTPGRVGTTEVCRGTGCLHVFLLKTDR